MEGVCDSLVVMFATARCQGPRFSPARAEIWIEISAPCAVVHPCSASRSTTSDTRASPKPGNSPKK